MIQADISLSVTMLLIETLFIVQQRLGTYTVSLLINYCYVNPSESLFRGHLCSRDICLSPEGVLWTEVPLYQNTQCLFAFVFWKHVAHMAILNTLFGHVAFLPFWEAILMFCSLKMLLNCQDIIFFWSNSTSAHVIINNDYHQYRVTSIFSN